jgi:predicted metallo-beta-lactamase superfamily hydrolase
MYTESQIYTKKLLFMDEPQQFLQNHQRQVGFLFEEFISNKSVQNK